MERLAAILMAVLLAATPVLSYALSECGCCVDRPPSVHEIRPGDERPADTVRSCCSGPADRIPGDGPTGGPGDRSEQDPCKDSDCSRLCCTFAKAMATPGKALGARMTETVIGQLVSEPTGATASPHLRDLNRPPRPVTAA